MSDEDREARSLDNPLEEILGRQLSNARKGVLVEWTKAVGRADADPDGAITSARALVEATCKQVLGELNVAFGPNDDLPKLYREVSHVLGLAPNQATDRLYRSVFSAAHQVMQIVAEMRNKFGDAHGKGMGAIQTSRSQAELTVNLAGTLSSFLISGLESHLSATRRRTRDGRAILKFDKTTVWRLVDHSANAPHQSLYFGETVGPCLLLVGDAGIYLMSNGKPGISHKGRLHRVDEDPEYPLLVAHAEGCGPTNEVDNWWPLHNLIAGGSDFSIPLPLVEFEGPLLYSEHHIVIIANSEEYVILADVEYEDCG